MFVCEGMGDGADVADVTCFTVRADWRDVAPPLKKVDRLSGMSAESRWIVACAQGQLDSDPTSWLGGPLAWGRGEDVFGYVAVGARECVLSPASFAAGNIGRKVGDLSDLSDLAAAFYRDPALLWSHLGPHCCRLLFEGALPPLNLRLAIDEDNAQTALAAIVFRSMFPHAQGVLTSPRPFSPPWRRLAQNLGFGQAITHSDDFMLAKCGPAFELGAGGWFTRELLKRGSLLPPKLAARAIDTTGKVPWPGLHSRERDTE